MTYSTHAFGKLKKEHTHTHTGRHTPTQINRHVCAHTHAWIKRRRPDTASWDGSGATNDEDNFLTAAGSCARAQGLVLPAWAFH